MIRTRFAPSPTGFMHIGNLRTALYAYLIAKNKGGTFILRIEDTDRERYVKESLDFIYKTLQMVGINYDEGPEREGTSGPYIQSMRTEIYQKYAKILVENKNAYYCFCEKNENIETENKKPHRCDCINLKNPTTEKPHVIRQIIPDGKTTFYDVVYGVITVDNSELENGVLLKSNGFPTYNFANVVDDHLMNITHVIRGSEYLSSTPKYNLLYNAFGWDIPVYIHLPLILGSDKTKLSKRNGDANFSDLLNEGYLPEAIINYIALLGWSPEESEELFSLKELEKKFTLTGIGKSPAIYDKKKLDWFNTEYIKKLDFDDFYKFAYPYLKNIKKEVDYKKIASFLRSRITFFKDIVNLVSFIDELEDYDTNIYIHKKMKTDLQNSLISLQEILIELEKLENFNFDNLNNIIKLKIEILNVKNSIVLWPIRTALSGKPTSFCGAIELLEIFGKEESIRRIKIGIDKIQKTL
ncbi:MAG: glutamate--tRNA ligase [Defluviitaleaceae bacterium]|nr:glutamate--tRNA ligase [Defluviitaleaceae bacterium]